MPVRRIPPQLRGRVFTRRDVAGLDSDSVLSRGPYENLARGVWRAGEGEPTYAERVAGFLAVLPPHAALVGASAAWALGAWEPRPLDPVEVAVHPPGSVRSREGLVVSGRVLRPEEVIRRRGHRTSTVLRTAVDVARRDGEPQQVVPLLDAVLHRGGLSPDQVLQALAQHSPRAAGTPRARVALAMADARAESPRESLLRLMVVAAGLPRPQVQYEITPQELAVVGYWRGVRLDLAWPTRRVAVEYDGADAHDHRARSRDLARHNALRALGWVVIQVDAEGMRRPEVFLAQLAAALA